MMSRRPPEVSKNAERHSENAETKETDIRRQGLEGTKIYVGFSKEGGRNRLAGCGAAPARRRFSPEADALKLEERMPAWKGIIDSSPKEDF